MNLSAFKSMFFLKHQKFFLKRVNPRSHHYCFKVARIGILNEIILEKKEAVFFSFNYLKIMESVISTIV